MLATLATIFALIVLFLLEGPEDASGPAAADVVGAAAYYTRVACDLFESATGYAFGNLLRR